ncbi:hypothetical protein EYF80_035087 [Liparis tanakae]|uniref:Uncharacterized protein n=1 Tax=Liparis tanakae TaxID=230148 RepID=A0A4Z2GPI3_9TELE|nr:hypothetical protein EYF80_035087 [Liparis tanakae]
MSARTSSLPTKRFLPMMSTSEAGKGLNMEEFSLMSKGLAEEKTGEQRSMGLSEDRAEVGGGEEISSGHPHIQDTAVVSAAIPVALTMVAGLPHEMRAWKSANGRGSFASYRRLLLAWPDLAAPGVFSRVPQDSSTEVGVTDPMTRTLAVPLPLHCFFTSLDGMGWTAMRYLGSASKRKRYLELSVLGQLDELFGEHAAAVAQDVTLELGVGVGMQKLHHDGVSRGVDADLHALTSHCGGRGGTI